MAEEAAKRVIAEHQEKDKAKRQAEALEKEVADAARREARTAKIASIFITVLVVGIFELIIRAVVPWRWLLDHPNGYGLEGCFILILGCGIIGLGVKTWRKGLWITGLVGAVLVALQIMGGSPTP